MSEEMTIRRAVLSDSHSIAVLLARAWQWAYRGLIHDDYLAAFAASVPEKERWYREQLAQVDVEWRTWVAERGERSVGFAVTGPSRDPDAEPGTAEVWGIYLHPDVVGTGVGRALFAHSVDDLRRRGYETVTIWVLEGNARARRFYEAAGCNLDGGTKIEQRPGFELHEVRYRINVAAIESPSPEDPTSDDSSHEVRNAKPPILKLAPRTVSPASFCPDRQSASPPPSQTRCGCPPPTGASRNSP